MKRRSELDDIRACAFLLIFLFHFNQMLNTYQIDTIPLFLRTNGWTLGSLGVGLFLMLSGYVLPNSFERGGLKLTTFYKKRFFAIFPLFYACYFIAYLWIDLPAGHFFAKNQIWSILGFDGFLTMRGFNTSYRIGEWYLGVILIYYLLFPFLSKAIKKAPLITGLFIATAHILFIVFYPFSYSSEITVLGLIPEFVIGIYLAFYVKEIRLPAVVAALFVFIIMSVWDYPGYALHSNLIAVVALFLAFALPWKNGIPHSLSACRFPGVGKTFSTLAKYSFTMFLLHHIIQERMLSSYAGRNICFSWYKYFAYLIFCFLITFLLSYLVQNGVETIMKALRGWFAKKFTKEKANDDQTSINT